MLNSLYLNLFSIHLRIETLVILREVPRERVVRCTALIFLGKSWQNQFLKLKIFTKSHLHSFIINIHFELPIFCILIINKSQNCVENLSDSILRYRNLQQCLLITKPGFLPTLFQVSKVHLNLLCSFYPTYFKFNSKFYGCRGLFCGTD